jgi:hypothetical protein
VARAYLLTDQMVTETAARHAQLRPELDEVSRRAMGENATSATMASPNRPGADTDGSPAERGRGNGNDPEAILWAALALAPDEGVSVPDLVSITGMSRRSRPTNSTTGWTSAPRNSRCGRSA